MLVAVRVGTPSRYAREVKCCECYFPFVIGIVGNGIVEEQFLSGDKISEIRTSPMFSKPLIEAMLSHTFYQ